MSESERPRAVLLALQLPQVSDADVTASLEELTRLVDTMGLRTVGSVRQKRSGVAGGTVVGEGKLRELARWTGGSGVVASAVKRKKSKAAERFAAETAGDDDEEMRENDDADDASESARGSVGSEDTAEPGSGAGPEPREKAEIVVYDGELTPSQIKNLESATGAEVMDRTGVIIEIFSRHARTKAARLQVEIARLRYLAPRLREVGGGGDRQGGGIGGKGAGESSQELDRRRIRDRIKELKDELEAVQHEHDVRRSRRSSENSVALVGYTNAGKSSLMRALTGSEIYVADKLFATLDTTVRPLHPPTTPKILLTDTVGFVKKLPHDLVASFKSTLDEAHEADCLLFVVDASDPAFRSQLKVTKDVIGEIGAGEIASRLVLNKRDRLTSEAAAALRDEFPDAIMISTRDPQDLARIRGELVAFFEKNLIEAELLIPYAVKGAMGEIRERMAVIGESFDEKGARLRVKAAPEILERVRKKFGI